MEEATAIDVGTQGPVTAAGPVRLFRNRNRGRPRFEAQNNGRFAGRDWPRDEEYRRGWGRGRASGSARCQGGVRGEIGATRTLLRSLLCAC